MGGETRQKKSEREVVVFIELILSWVIRNVIWLYC